VSRTHSKDIAVKVVDKSLDYRAVAAFVQPQVDYWKKMLRLEDWSVKIAIVDHKENQNFWARVSVKPWFQAAYMEVVNPFTDPDRIKPGVDKEHDIDLEVSLVHELLHLRYEHGTMGVKKKNKGSWYAYESATEITARALVAARHGVERIMSE
jgi:hypothetical protein